MELDELKYQLKDKLSTDHTGRSDADIALLLTKRTASVTDKLKKSLWLEIFLCILMLLVFGAISIISKQSSLRIYFSVFTIVGIVFLLVVIYLLRRTKKLSSTTLPVKSNLQSIVRLIEEFTRRYFQITMALIPICFIFALLLAYQEKHLQDPSAPFPGGHYFSSLWQVVLFVIAYMFVLAIVAFYFTKWYLKKLYGKYVQQLKACIEELGE